MYTLTRPQALAILKEYAAKDGSIEAQRVYEALLAPTLREQDIAWAYQRARKHHMVDMCMPTDPRLAQILAMDT